MPILSTVLVLPAWLAGLPWIVWVIIILILFTIGLELLGLLWYALLNTKCQLRRRLILPDSCGGDCPTGQVCRATATKPYGPWGRFGTQDAACACVAAGAGGTGGAAAGPAGGSGQSDKEGE